MKERILDVVKGGVATAALFLAYISIPLIGMLPGIFAPAPAVYYSLKSGRTTGLGVVLAALLLLSALGDPAALIVYVLQAAVVSIALPEFLARRIGGARSIVYAVAVGLVVILAAVVIFGMATGMDLHAKVIHGVDASITQTALVYQRMGVKGEDLRTLQESMRQAAALIVTIYPALVTVALGVMAALNLALVSRVAARFRVPVYRGEFRKYRNPDAMVWLLIVAGFSLLVPQSLVHLTALNATIILATLYTVQGFAIVSHYFVRLGVPMFARVVFTILLVLQPFLTLAVTALGIFDLWGNFRSPKQPKNL